VPKVVKQKDGLTAFIPFRVQGKRLSDRKGKTGVMECWSIG
jgi:hypothetical protein